MHIVLLCATNRGYRFAERLFQLGRGHSFTVFSFRETAWEPPFLDDIRTLTEVHGHRFIAARNVASKELQSFWQQNPVELLLMVSWRYLVPAEVYGLAKRGSFVFHDSLLPKYRGFAPTVWAVMNGEKETGVTLFRAAEDVDAGDIVAQRQVAISKQDPILEVMEKVTRTYLELTEQNFTSLLDGSATSYAQNHDEATYTCKWTPADAQIDWYKGTREIYNLIRATGRPYPGAYTILNNVKLTIWSADLPRKPREYVSRAPGRVVELLPDCGATVLTGDGSILLKTVQLEGDPATDASQLLRPTSQTLGESIR